MKLLCFAALALSTLLVGAAPDGEALYKARCAACHDGKPQPRMPSREDIGKLSPEEIVKTMMTGAIQPQSAGITAEDGRAIARYVTGKEFGKVEASTSGICPGGAKPFRLEGEGCELVHPVVRARRLETAESRQRVRKCKIEGISIIGPVQHS